MFELLDQMKRCCPVACECSVASVQAGVSFLTNRYHLRWAYHVWKGKGSQREKKMHNYEITLSSRDVAQSVLLKAKMKIKMEHAKRAICESLEG